MFILWGGGRENVVGLWTLGKVCAMVSAMKSKPSDSQTCAPGANNTLYANKKN